MTSKFISIRGAREHNLKNISLELPREKLVVITGLSGSGKSSLAFDTIYAEGQRRYVESLSAYARQFLDMMQKPDVDHIDGPVAGHLHRAENHLAQPALDRRHGHRDLRLYAAALGAGRHSLFAGDRTADREPDREPDGRPRAGAARGHAALSAGADRARAEGRIQARISPSCRRRASSGSRSTASSTRSPRSRPRQESTSTISKWWSTASWCAPTSSARLANSFETALQLTDDSIAIAEFADEKDKADHLLGEVRLPGVGLHHRGDRAQAVLVQQPLWRLSRMRRARHRAVLRARADRSRRDPEPRARRHRALGAHQRDLALLSADAGSRWRAPTASR